MREDEGFQILHNGVPRTFRDNRETAYEAARYAKARTRSEIIEIIDRSARTKLGMLADLGRLSSKQSFCPISKRP